MKKLLDVQLPFFIPLWRRVALVAFSICWAIMEFALGNTGWSVFFALISLYLAHQFFMDFDPASETSTSEDSK